MMRWVYDPHSGGTKIPPAVQERTARRILAYAEAHYAGKYTRIDVRFRNGTFEGTPEQGFETSAVYLQG